MSTVDCDSMTIAQLKKAIAKSKPAQEYMDQSHVARPKKRTLCGAVKYGECVERKLKKNCFSGGAKKSKGKPAKTTKPKTNSKPKATKNKTTKSSPEDGVVKKLFARSLTDLATVLDAHAPKKTNWSLYLALVDASGVQRAFHILYSVGLRKYTCNISVKTSGMPVECMNMGVKNSVKELIKEVKANTKKAICPKVQMLEQSLLSGSYESSIKLEKWLSKALTTATAVYLFCSESLHTIEGKLQEAAPKAKIIYY
jgi:hypothetical protein